MRDISRWVMQVDPIIIHPHCYKAGNKQDCFNCDLHVRVTCRSPRGLCIKIYPNHKNGCPNYNKNGHLCPPNAPIFDAIFDLSKPVYAIYNIFDFKSHVERMRGRHPQWSQRQLECCLYWQGSARKELRKRINIFKAMYTEYVVTTIPEGMGVNVTKTMKNVGIEIEWPPHNVTYQIAFAGQPKGER